MRTPWRAGLAALTLAASAVPHIASSVTGTPPIPCAAHAPEAAVRSEIAVDIILRVMRLESAGDPQARSPKGAMGCMQIMPATWQYLAPRYELGVDPFDARMNMIGGAMYLAELRRRFGMPGAFAAYSAGPTRYQRFVDKGVMLPTETVAYVSRIGVGRGTPIVTPTLARWQDAGLFLVSAQRGQPTETLPTKQEADALFGIHGVEGRSSPAGSARTVATLFPLSGDAGPIQR